MMKKFQLTSVISVMALLITVFLFAGEISAQTPQYYNYQNVGASNNNFPFNVAGGKASHWLFLPGDFNQPSPCPAGKQITKLYFWLYAGGSPTYTNFVILMAKDTITSIPTGTFYSGPMDTVYFKSSVTLSGTSGSWASITLDKPYAYDPAKSLIVFIGQCGTAGTGWTIKQNDIGGVRRVWSIGGCPFNPYNGGDGSMANLGIDVASSSGSPNYTLKLATPGVNTTYVSVPYQASMVGFGNNITIETWVKPGGTTTAATILNKGVASFDYQLGVSLSTMLPFFRAGGNIATCPFAVVANQWQHLAVVSNGSTVTFYLNGVAGTPVSLACTLGSSANEMRIGRGNSDAGSGWLDELRVWSVARTGPEILANMCNKWIPNNAPGLKAKWHFDSTLVDSVSGWNGTLMGTAGYDTLTMCTVVTNLSGIGSIMPKTYSLSQNYPNPFNPVTKINFAIPKSGFVTLRIYDILGRQLVSLVNETKNPGNYSVDFNASSLNSGVYFYRLEVNGFTDTKKMLLIK
jgi:hypothetical protein